MGVPCFSSRRPKWGKVRSLFVFSIVDTCEGERVATVEYCIISVVDQAAELSVGIRHLIPILMDNNVTNVSHFLGQDIYKTHCLTYAFP